MSPKPKILSPFETWQSLFTYLFEHHYGLALNDTPFHDVEVMAEHINAGVTPLEAVNLLNATTCRVSIAQILA